MDSTKLLTEKLTLARELSSLRPEIDHLRSQATSHQSLLAEKLSLQRQLSTILVELETEKRSTQRVLTKENKSNMDVEKLESRIETLQADLGKERRDRQRVELEIQKLSAESENRNTSLESRLNTFRNKLKTTKCQLKETQAALESAQNAHNATSSRAKRPNDPTTSFATNSRKRPAMQMDVDTMIGTPGDLPAAKKNKRGSSLVGEKSTFSITPFLNRTASMAPESPSSGTAGSYGGTTVEPVVPVLGLNKPNHVFKSVPKSSEPTGNLIEVTKPVMLDHVKPSKANSKGLPGRKLKAVAALEQVAEEGDAENDGAAVPVVPMPRARGSKDVFDATFNEGAETKKKKRKRLGGVLGGTVFDEDEGDAIKGDGGLLGGVRGFGTLGRGGLTGPKFCSRKVAGASMSTFGVRSLLKRDR